MVMRGTWWSRYVSVAMGSYALDSSFFFFFFLLLLDVVTILYCKPSCTRIAFGCTVPRVTGDIDIFPPGGARPNLLGHQRHSLVSWETREFFGDLRDDIQGRGGWLLFPGSSSRELLDVVYIFVSIFLGKISLLQIFHIRSIFLPFSIYHYRSCSLSFCPFFTTRIYLIIISLFIDSAISTSARRKIIEFISGRECIGSCCVG